MSDSEDVRDRLARLEQRVAELEGRAPRRPVAPPPPPAPPPRPRTAEPSAPFAVPRLALSEGAEVWLGQRGLLAIGVLALLLAAGYLLKLSFDRGWVSPLIRCITGAGVGAGVGLLGWRLLARYRTYGAALIGCGAGICYLVVWAASRLYGFLPPATGIAGLALVSLSLAAVAWSVNVEALAATATVGLLMAPVLLGQEQVNSNALILYLTVAALALGAVCSLRRWRLTTFLLAAGTIWLAFIAEPGANPLGTLALAAVVGTGGLAIGLREHWWETRLASFTGGWALVAAAGQRLQPDERWPLLAAALALAVPVWLLGLREHPDPASPSATRRNWAAGERLYFLLTPLLVTLALNHFAETWFATHVGAAPAIVAIPYLVASWVTRRAAFTGVAAVMLVLATVDRWNGEKATGVLLALALAWMGAAVLRRWRDALWAAAGTFLVAAYHLMESAARTESQRAFIGPWALAAWATVGTAALCAYLASRVRREEWPGTVATSLVPAFATASAAALFFCVTAELGRFCRQQLASPEAARLAGGLSISAWWILFAATLVLLGFRRDVAGLRFAGLGVAAAAVMKVLFRDLASLDAFYRIGSVFILGIVSLGLAWLYHRQARAKMENA